MNPKIFYHYMRFKTDPVQVGNIGIGGENPIRIQSMLVSDTMNTEAVVDETEALVEAGCEIVRITVPTVHHAEHLKNIRQALKKRGISVPLVADIHFMPQAAFIAAEYVEKIRINPGNFADRKLFKTREYTDSEYDAELDRLREKFLPLVKRCKSLGVAMRIGTNHGSLSDRILNRYGDTPLGMVESALEFIRICEDESYRSIVLSMKASNTQIMVQAYRLLVSKMQETERMYPLHLGVTEAGEGEDGRIKSAIGILTLLEDGIGDTIRVSLTEDSVFEIPVAKALVKKLNTAQKLSKKEDGVYPPLPFDPFSYKRRLSRLSQIGVQAVGSTLEPRVQMMVVWKEDPIFFETLREQIESLSLKKRAPELVAFRIQETVSPDWIEAFLSDLLRFKKHFPMIAFGARLSEPAFFTQIAPMLDFISMSPQPELSEVAWRNQAIEILRIFKELPTILEWRLDEFCLPSFVRSDFSSELLYTLARLSKEEGVSNVRLCWAGNNFIHENRYLAGRLQAEGLDIPLHLSIKLDASKDEDLLTPLVEASGSLGPLLIDGLGDSVEVLFDDCEYAVLLAWNILQGARRRLSKVELIACPSCGRTLFDLQSTTARIKQITAHLTGVKIAVMGCIVNGPGEMADADFGYVGAGPGRIHLYVGKDCVEKNILQEEADSRLVRLIKEHGKWIDP